MADSAVASTVASKLSKLGVLVYEVDDEPRTKVKKAKDMSHALGMAFDAITKNEGQKGATTLIREHPNERVRARDAVLTTQLVTNLKVNSTYTTVEDRQGHPRPSGCKAVGAQGDQEGRRGRHGRRRLFGILFDQGPDAAARSARAQRLLETGPPPLRRATRFGRRSSTPAAGQDAVQDLLPAPARHGGVPGPEPQRHPS
jgi:hypothetical protein